MSGPSHDILLAAWQQGYPHMMGMAPHFGGGMGGGFGGIFVRVLLFSVLFRIFRFLTLPQLLLLALVVVVLVVLWRRARLRNTWR